MSTRTERPQPGDPDGVRMSLSQPEGGRQRMILGGITVDVPESPVGAWTGLVVRARSHARMAGIAAACGVEGGDSPLSAFSFFGMDDQTSPVFNDGSVQSYQVPLVGQEGADRLQFLSGEPFSLRVGIATSDGVPPPKLQLELRDDAGTLVAGEAVDLRGLGWAPGNGQRALRFDIGSLPLADGRFHLRLGLTDEAGERLYHWLDDALVFVVYPGEDERGVVRFEGTWTLEAN